MKFVEIMVVAVDRFAQLVKLSEP